MDIVVVGSIAQDRIHLPGREPEVVFGGSAVYSALSAGKFEVEVGIVGVVGDDEEGRHILEAMSEFPRLDLKGISVSSGRTFFWEGRYFEDINQRETISLDLGVFAEFSPMIPKEYQKTKALFLANIAPTLQREVLSQISADLVMMDTMDHWILNHRDEILDLLRQVDVLVLNDQEARLLARESNLFRAGSFLLEALEGGMVLIKRGDCGALIFETSDLFFVPAYPLENAVDPTGAGDSFAGAFLGAWLEFGNEANPCLSAYYATSVASFCVEDVGPKRLIEVSRKEIDKRVAVLNSIMCRRWDSNPHVRKDTWS